MNAGLDDANLEGAILLGTKNLTLMQILKTKNYKKARLPEKLEKELKEWQAKQAKEKAGAGGDSEENPVEE